MRAITPSWPISNFFKVRLFVFFSVFMFYYRLFLVYDIFAENARAFLVFLNLCFCTVVENFSVNLPNKRPCAPSLFMLQ